MPSDRGAELMRAFRAGDPAAFEQLVVELTPPVHALLTRLLRDEAAAEDLTQETFLRVFRTAESYQPSALFITFAYRIATNLAHNYRRDQARRPGRPVGHDADEPEPEAADPRALEPAEELERAERAALVRRAIDELPEAQRLAVLLTRYQHLSYEEAAQVLDLSRSAVKSLLFRAHEHLRERLARLLDLEREGTG